MSDRSLSRRQSRRKAFELLFELEQHPGLDAAAILDRTFEQADVVEVYLVDEDGDGYVSGPIDDSAKLFICELVQAVKKHETELDLELAKYPHDWSFDRLGVPERVLLRLALAEMVYIGTSHKVVIDEALDMTKVYAQDDARRFVNGILGAAMRNLDKLKADAHSEEAN
jgi:transcription antitermination protein NusB